MINRLDIEERVREWGLREDVVEKDYVLGWVLWGIGSDPVLSKTWAFKGGTCLKKCYLETYRFSEDLDFTVLPDGPILGTALAPLVAGMLERVTRESGIQFSGQAPLFKTNATSTYTDGRIYYRGPRMAPNVATIKLDLSASEKMARSTVIRGIAHAYPDVLPGPATVPCYSFEEVFAEKIRAMGERSRPRDLYDIINLYRRQDLRDRAALIHEILVEKCESKGVAVPTMQALAASPLHRELQSEWASMLAHQLPELPPFEAFWIELPQLFSWIEGAVESAAPLRPVQIREAVTAAWLPPPTVTAWGFGVPLECIRFGASNHLCIELGYKGSVRLVEPYAFRKSKAGDLLFCAVKVDTGETRSYRVDRIESLKISGQTFRPKYLVEVGSISNHGAPLLNRKNSSKW